MTPPKLPDFLSESGFTTLLPEKRGQLRTRISAILKSRKELARSALPDAVNRAEGAFMTPALYPAPRSQGGRGRSFGHNADPRPLSESRRQRPTAAQTAQGVSQPHPSSEKPTQGEGPPKSKGFGSLIQRVTPLSSASVHPSHRRKTINRIHALRIRHGSLGLFVHLNGRQISIIRADRIQIAVLHP